MGTLNMIRSDAAGIDIGSEFHYVCVPADRSKHNVKKFGCYTHNLHELADWLAECRVTSVAMESTGVYWIPLFEILDARGFEVILVNARHVKNVPGRKTDVSDCQWIQQLHSCGLLRGSFRPDDHICVLRGYMRQRDNLVKGAVTHVQRMQKALTQMNVQLHKVISSITGKTGMRILQAIVEGERDPVKLARLRDSKTKNSEVIIANALNGNYRQEHLFALKQELELYNIYQAKIAQCDEEIMGYYTSIDSKHAEQTLPPKDKPNTKDELERISGVDLTKIPGLDTASIQVILSETGTNPDKWSSDKHFASWLGLSPANKITGEKVYSTRTRKVSNRASTSFRMAALSAGKSKTAIGAYYRRIKSRIGAPKAITATARKLACLFYNMLKHGEEYVEQGMSYYEEAYKDRLVKGLTKRAKELGFTLMENAAISVC